MPGLTFIRTVQADWGISVSSTPKCDTVNLFGVQVAALRMNELVNIAHEHIHSRKRLLVGVVNVAKIVNMQKDPKLFKCLKEADLVLADGMPIVWLSRLLGDRLPERVAGIDIMLELLKQANDRHYRVYFLGTESQVLQKVVAVVQRDYPGICIAGYRDGYFDKHEEQNVAEDIRKSNADMLFVGIKTPQKEYFLQTWQDFVNVPVCHGVGGSFDILAGVTKRAPLWMQKSGLEWAYRFFQEPKRMWKRYIVTNTIFIRLSFEEILKTRLSGLLRRF